MGKDKQRRVMPFWMPRTEVENNPIGEWDWHGYTIPYVSTFYIHSTYYTLTFPPCFSYIIVYMSIYNYPCEPLENVFCNKSISGALGEGKQDQALRGVVVASTAMLLPRQHGSTSLTAYSLKLLRLVPYVQYTTSGYIGLSNALNVSTYPALVACQIVIRSLLN